MILAGVAVAGLLLLMRGGSGAHREPEQRAPQSANLTSKDSSAIVRKDAIGKVSVEPPPAGISTATPTETNQQAYVAARIGQLQELAMEDDPESLDVILSELINRDPEIRKAAVEAAVQFGSRDAISKLEEASLQTDDPKERAAIVEAIEFLKLPSLTEVKAGK
jgi:hypothetical protein